MSRVANKITLLFVIFYCYCCIRRLVFESQSEKDLFESHLGIYIFTSGIPDQDSEVISSYLEAKRCTFLNTHVHVALYHVDNTITDKHFPCRYANITETANSLR